MSKPHSLARSRPDSRVVEATKPRLWKTLGPGLITGAADDDPSGIATYAQAGAQFGFSLAWTLLISYPLMVAIQSICARIGRTTGLGIAGNLRKHYPNWLLQAIISLLFAANVLNLGADLGAMAESARLLVPLPAWLGVLLFGAFTIAGQVFLKHTRYVALLKWLTLSLLAYFGTLATVHIPWGELMHGLLWPRWSADSNFWLTVVAILGTTISPYLFFWQAAQEVEDTKTEPRSEPLLRRPGQAPRAFARIRTDTLVGMAFSNLVALAILITSAVTLHSQGAKEVGTAAQAAQALRPVAGTAAFVLFAAGIIGTGLLSVPVLAGSAAYALGEARRWPVGLSRAPLQAKAFYGAIAVATALGAAANLMRINPIKALVWAAVLNGIVAAPVMVMVMLLGGSRAVMGKFRLPLPLRVFGWLSTAVMAGASIALLYLSL
ncbi:MAG TPA: divalent metal cation transporter [Steroidobacteraceae bacterium]|jgi:NRAMP (natural resistance-associated macrophage protein)-like metal ion transporter